jgi:thiamine biosynthesis protein ThiS
MEIIVNGRAREVPDACTLDELLAAQAVEPAHIVVEINRQIVPKDDYGSLWIRPGDRVEILRFVGGG